ncbi:MAG: hypothetical protein WC678_04100 [Parcubacteria group bacterium]
MVNDGNYAEPEMFAGPDGFRKPKYFETPEGILKWNLKNYEDTMVEMREKHPDDWEDFVPESSLKRMREIKNLLKFIKDEQKETSEDTSDQSEKSYTENNQDENSDEKTKEVKKQEKIPEKKDAKTKVEQKKEKLEGEELFQYQIENNSHPLSKSLKDDTILFIESLNEGISGPGMFQSFKEELSEILYRSGVIYEEDKEIEIDEENREILQPLLDFRKELDQWNTVTEVRKEDFRKRVIKYTEDTFGMEIQAPNEGEDYKNKGKATKTVETKNEFLNDKIKKVLKPGFKINEKLFNHYEKWFREKEQEISNKRNTIKSTVSDQEFDRIFNEDQAWLTKHRFAKAIKPAQIEIYKYKA